jgi:hypothetical protein
VRSRSSREETQLELELELELDLGYSRKWGRGGRSNPEDAHGQQLPHGKLGELSGLRGVDRVGVEWEDDRLYIRNDVCHPQTSSNLR